MEELIRLKPGMPIPYGGNRVTFVDEDLATRFLPGDRLVVVQTTGALLHVPKKVWARTAEAVTKTSNAFSDMASVSDEAITAFYHSFADRLETDSTFAQIKAANRDDVDAAISRGMTSTRLVLSDRMRSEMIIGLRSWAHSDPVRGRVVESVQHEGWRVETVLAGVGVVGFVFEGRPNVFADATGVLRSGNTVVFRIGSAALGTARAIVSHALEPAIADAGLPPGAVTLVDEASRAAGWAMFADERLGLAIARGSGHAVSQLGAVAHQSGTPVSLHGTGGAWIVAGETAKPDDFFSAVCNSLDRKVCNTLNTCTIARPRAGDLVAVFLDALKRAGELRTANPKLHVAAGCESFVPDGWWDQAVIGRADGDVNEPQAEPIRMDQLGHEWQWESSPEVTLAIVDTVPDAVAAFNAQSPRFVASLISESADEHDWFFANIDSPFVGNGFTRWVDGQYALGRPELGLSNWQSGRLFGRGAVLSGDSAFTIRTRAVQNSPHLRR